MALMEPTRRPYRDDEQNVVEHRQEVRSKDTVAADNSEFDDFHETMAPAAAAPRHYYRTEEVATTTHGDTNARSLYGAERIVNLIAGLITGLLAMRIVLELLGANAANGFAQLIYGITYPFAAPYNSLFNYSLQAGISRFDLPAVIGIIVVSLIAYLITRLLRVSRV